MIGREAFVGFMMENPADYYYGVLWNKLYRRSLVAVSYTHLKMVRIPYQKDHFNPVRTEYSTMLQMCIRDSAGCAAVRGNRGKSGFDYGIRKGCDTA